jgi:hypothetical protein
MAQNALDQALEHTPPPVITPQQKDEPNPFADAVAEMAGDRERRLRSHVRQAADTTPDRRAQALKYAEMSGLPVDLIERNFGEVEKDAKVNEVPYGQLFEQNPKLAQWLSADPSNAAIAADDHDALKKIEQSISFGGAIRRGVDSVRGMGAGALEATGELVGSELLEAYGQRGREAHRASAEALGPRQSFLAIRGPWELVQWVKETVGEQIPIMAPIMAGAGTGAAVGSVVPVIGTSIGAAIGAFIPALALGVGEVQGTIKEIDPEAEAPAAAFIGGAAVAAFDSVLPGRIGSRLVTTFGRETAEQIAKRALLAPVKPQFVRRGAGGMATEGLTEALQEAIGATAAAAGTDTAIPGDLWRQMVEAGAAGALVGGVTTTAETAIERRMMQAQIAAAEQSKVMFDALAQGVTDSKLMARMPEAAQAFVAEVTKDGPLETVYAPLDTFTEYFQSKGIDPGLMAAELTGNVDAYAEAQATGADLAIPTAAYAVQLAGTEHHAYFANELRFGPEMMNARESQAAKADLEQQLAAETQEAADAAGVVEPPAPTVGQTIADRLTAFAGVPADTAGKYAQSWDALFGELAGDLGIDPVTMLERYGVRIARPDTANQGSNYSETITKPSITEEKPEVDPSSVNVEAPNVTVYDRQGAKREEPATYRPAAGEAVGVEGPNGFALIEDRGGSVPADVARVDRQATSGAPSEASADGDNPQAGQRPADDDGQRRPSDEGRSVEERGDGPRAQRRRLPAPEDYDADVAFERASPDADAARLTPEVTRELGRMAEEMREFPFEPNVWTPDDASGRGWIGNAGGGHWHVVAGGAGAPVFDDVRVFAPMNKSPRKTVTVGFRDTIKSIAAAHTIEPKALAKENGLKVRDKLTEGQKLKLPRGEGILGLAQVNSSRGDVTTAMEKVLASGVIHNNLAEGAVRVAERRAADDYRHISRPLLPPSWGIEAPAELPDQLSAAIDEALEAQGLSAAQLEEQGGDDSFDPTEFEQASLIESLEPSRSQFDIGPTVRPPFPIVTMADGQRLLDAAGPPHQETIPVDALVATQDWLFPPIAIDYAGGRARASLPTVLHLNGRYYVADGHHRASGDWANGEDAIEAMVRDVDPAKLVGGEPTEFFQGLFDEDDQVDTLDTGEQQPRLPGAGDVRDQNIATPEFEAPFALTSEVARPRKGKQSTLFQGKRGSIQFGADRQFTINLFANADLSTFLHESGHFFLEVFGDVADDLAQRDPSTLTDRQRKRLADYGAALQWLGVENRREITTEQHEQWARGFEAYLFEGKAPSEGLRATFAAYRDWLVGIYKMLVNLNVTLTPEVRQVFDRLLASDEAIANAQADATVAPIFLTAEEAGMTPDEFALYVNTVETASRAARERIDQQLLVEVARQQRAEWRARREQIREEVAGAAYESPVYRALAAMQHGLNPDGTPLVEDGESPPLKLSRQILIDRYGKDRLKALPRPYIYSAEGGLDPNTVAEMFGFASGDALLVALPGTPPIEQAIEQETDRRMLAEHGSLLLDGILPEAARAAMANEEREAVLRAELAALGRLRRTVAPFERAAGQRQRAGVRALRGTVPTQAMLKEAAQARVRATSERNLKPHTYWVAARRASQQAKEAAAKQDFDAAIAFKQQELLSLALYRESTAAVEDIENRVADARAMGRGKARERIAKGGAGFLDQIDGILDRYEFARVSNKVLERRATIAAFVKALEDDGRPVDLPDEVLNDARRVNYRDITYEELVNVTDGLRQLAHLARTRDAFLKRQAKASLDELATDLAGSIRDNARKRRREGARDRRPAEERRRTVEDWFAGHRKLSFELLEQDGDKEGGPMWDAIMRPLNEAGAAETEMMATATRDFGAIVETAFPGRAKRELYVKRQVEAVGRSLSLMERLSIALQWGNEGGRDRIRRGDGWTDQQVDAVLDTLTDAHWTFVESTWKYLDSYWPAIAAKQERITGLAPERVVAVPYTTASGRVVTGGYMPLKYDDRLSAGAIRNLDLDAANIAKQAAFTQATTRRGHTKARVATVKMKVRLDFGVLFEHVGEVIHDLTHHEALVDVGRILGHKEVAAAILETHGDVVYKKMRATLRDVAFGDIPARNGFEQAINHVRIGATIAGLGWNVTTAFLQPLGLANSIYQIGPKWVGRGVARWLRHPTTMVETVDWISEKSAFMRSRGRTQQREINEIRNKVGVGTGRLSGWIDDILTTVTADHVTKDGIADSYFWMIQQMQRIADVPTWLGAYEKAMAANETEERAIAMADQAVLDSQGGGQIKDLAELQRGGSMMRLWTNFFSFFNVLYNQASRAKRRTDFSSPAAIGRLATDYMILFIVPATLGYFLREALRPGDDEDDENLTAALVRENLSYISGTMLGAREVSATIQGYYGYSGPAGARFFASLSRLGQQVQQGEADAALRRATVDVAGTLLHLPAGQVNRTLDGAAALAEGKTDNPLAIVTGAPKK